MIRPAIPCNAFAGIFTTDGINPYINPSNMKYPSIISISAKAPPIILEGVLPSLLYRPLKQECAIIAIIPLITNVAGAYTIYQKNMSARAEPIPAAANPYAGDKSHPERSTTQSPKFKYPLSGDGILIIIVATQQRAASKDAITIF